MSVQLLVENAIKHNHISENQPLKLRIYSSEDILWVENRLNIKESRDKSTGIGLRNLEARYKYVTGKPIVMENDGEVFRVGLPRITADL
jgi:LytS/YehU family sensor histidine kinase